MYPWEKWDHRMIEEKEKAHGLCQMVWGAIWLDNRGRPRRSELVIMDRDFESKKTGYSGKSYIKALEEGLLPYYQPGVRFQQDNASIHRAKDVCEWFERHGIWVIEWPPYSPDLNPIEHMWHALKRLVHKLYPDLDKLGRSQEDLDYLCKCLKEAWKKIPNSLIYKLITSMPRRLGAVRRARGYQTKY
jgi:transposase